MSSATTRVEVSYRYIGLSAAGDEFIAQFSEKAYEEFIAEWKTSLDAYFRDQQT